MKLVARWLGIVVCVVAAGCSVNHRSGDFACETQADCSSGRICSDGLCVATQLDASVRDGAVVGDAGTCPSQCTSCNPGDKSCTIDCMLNGGACNAAVTCPAGWSCNISCSTGNSCRSGVSCVGSKACKITCSGSQSCRNLTCGTGPCNVDCSGAGSCRNVACGASCACDVSCSNTALCGPLTCKSTACLQQAPLGCTSAAPGCNTCP